ncbi:hypothetical protein HDU86_007675 [Geranomyces michiganensis]|nr:hypothetical protein HDU86_007675 [Geranomyces michiganensis]
MLATSCLKTELQMEDSLQQLHVQTREVAAQIAEATIEVESRKAACTEAASEINHEPQSYTLRLRNFIKADGRVTAASEPLTADSLDLEQEIVM